MILLKCGQDWQPVEHDWPSDFIQNKRSYSFLWLPSHNTPLLLCLHPQKYTVQDLTAWCSIGLKELPLWLPSQNGCVVLLPQAHHQ
jgi:hypothetical protein